MRMHRQCRRRLFTMSPSPVHAVEPSAVPGATACFSVTCIAEPRLLPRLLEIWARRGLLPKCRHRVRREREAPEPAGDIEVDDRAPHRNAALHLETPGLFGVNTGTVSEKRA